MTAKQKTSAGKILHNSFWFGLESVFEMVLLLGTSIVVARYLGPTKLGYFSYINFFVAIVTRTSGTGLSTATRKYMSEFIALDRLGTARAVYNLAHRYQLYGALAISGLSLAGIAVFGEPQYRLMSSILILSLIPGVMSWVPAQANAAFEDVANNTLSALGYMVVYVAIIGLTLHYHWDLVGVASATLVSRSVEVILRTIPLNAKLRKLPLDTLDRETIDRIRRFCVQAIGLQLLMSVVWDRSEFVFLRWFSGLEQIAFYSVSFSLVNNLQLFPRIFGASTGITLMVEAGRDPERVDSIVQNSCRYMLLTILPISLGAAAIAYPAIHLTYGMRYLAAIPVVMIAAVLGIPRAFQGLPEILMRTADRQNHILFWYGLTGVLNIALDWVLIRRYGAVGAAWGNGVSQAFGVVAIWMQAKRFYQFSFPIKSMVRLSLASVIMAAAAYFLCLKVHGLPGLLLAVVVAAALYLWLVRLFHGLEASDRERLMPVGRRLPLPLRKVFIAAIEFVTPAAA